MSCWWVYTVKYHLNDSIEHLKAQLVVKGYTQIYGVDCMKPFFPVAQLNSVLNLISVAVNR